MKRELLSFQFKTILKENTMLHTTTTFNQRLV